MLRRSRKLPRVLLRSAAWLLGSVAALLMLVGGTAYLLARQSLPDYEGQHAVKDSGAPVRIVRDVHAVPHIYGETDGDVLFGLGYAHAQDRLWQMLINRAIVQGRVAERVGSLGLPFDRRMRILGLYEAAQRSLKRLPPDAVADLDAYAAGVNARLRFLASKPRGRGAPELFLFGNVPVDPWTPADSLAVIKLMALNLSTALWDEIGRARLLNALPLERARDLTPVDSAVEVAVRPGITPSPGALADGWPGGRFGGASNAWAVDGSRSSERRPLLATDPHLGFTAPTIWYLARLELDGTGGVIGATIPGLPAVVIGHNARVGWGLTHAYADDQDLYLEMPHPDDPQRYRTPEGWAAFETREERIRVRFQEDDEILLRRATRHGPVLPPEVFGLEGLAPSGLLHALRWTALDPDDSSYLAARQLMRASSVEEAIAALESYTVPMQVVTLADREAIARQVAGRAPLRRADSPSRGQVPGEGWDPRNDWQGSVPYVKLPSVKRPPSGQVEHANNQVADTPFPERIAHAWPAPYRHQRLLDLLGEREYHSQQGFRVMQNDTRSLMATTLLPLMRGAIAEPGEEETAEPTPRKQALKELWEWSGDMDAGSAAPLIFTAWLERLTDELVRRQLGDGARAQRLAYDPAQFVESVLLDESGAAWWCDHPGTTFVESCGEAVAIALDGALADIELAYGESVADWRWGRAHRARHSHLPLGFIWPLDSLVNLSHEMSGGAHTLQRAQHNSDGVKFDAVHGAGFRAIYNFAQLDRSDYVTSTGQSGHFLSPHYQDLGQLWRKGAYHRMSLNPADANLGSVGTLVLTPSEAATGE